MKREPNSPKKTKARGVEKTPGAAAVLATPPVPISQDMQQIAALVEGRADVLKLALEIANAGGAMSSRWNARRRAADLRARMAGFRDIYNAAWMVRYSQHGDSARRERAARDLCQVLANELTKCTDPEALIFAVADSITCSPHGLPWEG